MPTCDEGYVSKRVHRLMGELDCRSVIAIAADLKESIHGSGDTMCHEFMGKAAEVIRFYLDHWVENNGKHSPMAIRMSQYDRAVKELLQAAYKVYQEYMRRKD